MKTEKNPVDQAKDTGLALILILLILSYFRKQHNLILPAIGVLILIMTWPAVFKPLAYVWFGLSHRIGSIVSKVILTIIFALVVTPVGLIRRALGADTITLKKGWRGEQESTFLKRDHLFSAEDMEKPY